MEEGVIIAGFFLLMMKTTSLTTSAFVAVLTEKFDGSLMYLALTTSGRAFVVFRFQLQTLKILFYFFMASLLLSILELSMF